LAGTNKDNTQDLIKSIKYFAPNRKLSDKDITNILIDNRTQTEIAKEYKVSRFAIHAIKTGKTWRKYEQIDL